MSNGSDATGDWKEYRRLVLHELQRHSDWLENIAKAQQMITVELSNLKGKCVGWGAAAAILATLIINIMIAIVKKG